MNAEASALSVRALFCRPSAFVPPLLSLAAFAVVVGHVALFGAAREADEGAAAHVWQLMMAGQMPVMLLFLVKWLPRAPRPTNPHSGLGHSARHLRHFLQ